MSTFEQAWRRQLAFTALALGTLDPGKPLEQFTEDDRRKLTHTYIEALHSELVEVLNCTPWKSHRYNAPSSKEDLLTEIVDVQKFLWGLMQVWGFTPADFLDSFDQKSSVVERRFYQDHILPTQVMNSKIAIVDLDGTVADWDRGFKDWADAQSIQEETYSKSTNPGLRERLKDRMHSEGGMRGLHPIPGTREGVQELIEAGYTVVWLTARPIGKHPRLESDTVEWLKENNLPTDYVYWSDLNKHLFIAEKLPMAAVLFDDEPVIVAHAQELGLTAYLVNQEKIDFDLCVREFLFHD